MLLIPILGVALLYIVFQGDDSSDLETLASDKSSARPSNIAQEKADSNLPPAPLPPWPSFALDAMIAHNPFHVPEPPPLQCELKKEADEAPKKPAISSAGEVQKLRVSAVVSGHDGMIALVNNRMVRVGDTLDSGLVVVGIDEDAITVQRASP